MTRDPVAELYAARAASRPSSALLVPVRAPHAPGVTYWLSFSQYLALAWLRRRMRHHRGETTLERMAADLATTRGALSRRLDRLAQLSLIGRRSTRGRHGSTRFWPPRRARVALELARRAGAGGNVATSTPFGGFISREGLTRALRGSTGPPLAALSGGGSPPAAGGDRSRPAPRARRRPPHQLYARCPLDGGVVRLHRRELRITDWQHYGGPRRIRGTWSGRCRRCNALSIAPLDVRVPRRERRELTRADGSPAIAGPVVVRTPERAAAAAALLDSGALEDPELREAIRARWLPGRDPELAAVDPPAPELPVLVASDPADTAALVDLGRRWFAGDVDLGALEAAGYGPGRVFWDATIARRASRRGGRART